MLLFTFRHSTSCAVHCVTNVHGKDHPATQHTVPYYFSVYGEAFNNCWKSHPSTIQSGPSPLRKPFVWVFKESDARRVLCNKWGSPESHQFSFMNCWNSSMKWGFCRDVNTVHIFDWHMVFFLFVPLLNCEINLIETSSMTLIHIQLRNAFLAKLVKPIFLLYRPPVLKNSSLCYIKVT